ncbi:AAA family ATPase [Agromyces sp. LHK192]|uniref:helix-turn-helix transcriptional regulator n=1 Tax=Agromyces sp. LHK192 TaxID=2498704 RepID=UPI0013E2FB62|nr:AAA family ATPase [Agromyces sp. LHK192]
MDVLPEPVVPGIDVGRAWHDGMVTTSMSSPEMVGRQADLSWLEGLLEEAREGAPRTVVLGGEAGIGKTRLLREFATGLATDVRVLFGQCVDLGEVAAPYAPVKAALRGLVAELGPEAVLEAVGPGRASILALLPELHAVAPEAPALPAGAAGTGQLHEAIAVLLETLSRDQVIVLVIEDLHWIDMASLSLLRFLMRALTSSRVLIVLTYRTEDIGRGHPVRGFLSEIERDRWVERRELSRLTKAQVRKLARRLIAESPTDHALDTIYRRSEGVPFFIEELVGIDGCRDGSMPDTLRDLLLARYERLSEPTQQVLRLISTGGVRISHDLLDRVHHGDADELERAAREAVLAGVLTIDGDDYVFRHALVREAILDDLLPGERGRFHARYAEAYETLTATGTRRLAAEISFHWLGARDAERAFPATVQAMAEARAATAYATAAQLGERAIELWDVVADPERVAGMDKIELMGRTASHLRNAGESERSLAVIKAALDECPDEGLQAARLLRDQALTLSSVGRSGKAVALLREALERLGDADDPISRDLRATVLSALAGRLMVAGFIDEAAAPAREALELAVELGAARTASVAKNIQAVSLTVTGDIEESIEAFEEAKRLAEGDPPAMLRYWVNTSDKEYLLGRHRSAVDFAEQGLARARAQGLERSTGVLLAGNAVDPLIALGEWERADALIERGLALDPPPPFRVYLTLARARAKLWRGDPMGALAMLTPVREPLAHMVVDDNQTRLGASRLTAELLLETGDLAGAWRACGELFAGGPLAPGYDWPLAWTAARVLAMIVRSDESSREAAGMDGDALAEAVERLREVVDGFVVWPNTPVWRAKIDAELSEFDGPEVRVEAWREAVRAVDAPEAHVFSLPYATYRLGEAELAAGDRQAARASLQAARDLAEATGVTLVAQHVDRVAKAAGLAVTGAATGSEAESADAPARSVDAAAEASADPGIAELTARERQVLDLIAEGLSNRQIGERLFISGKTASVHVSAILRKLGASTRTEAAVRVGALR